MNDLQRRLSEEFYAWAKGTMLQGLPPQTLASVVSAFMGDLACRVLTEGIEIVEPHAEGCDGDRRMRWVKAPHYGVALVLCGREDCEYQARIPEALLVSLVEAARV